MCEKLQNVHFLGSKKYDVLPKYAQVFDVAVIPCVNNELIKNFNPLKLREYLAMGCPVVSMRFPEIEEFADVVQIADNYNEFIKNIEFVLNNDTKQNAEQRIAKVRSLSWENRFQDVTKIVDTTLTNKLIKVIGSKDDN